MKTTHKNAQIKISPHCFTSGDFSTIMDRGRPVVCKYATPSPARQPLSQRLVNPAVQEVIFTVQLPQRQWRQLVAAAASCVPRAQSGVSQNTGVVKALYHSMQARPLTTSTTPGWFSDPCLHLHLYRSQWLQLRMGSRQKKLLTDEFYAMHTKLL